MPFTLEEVEVTLSSVPFGEDDACGSLGGGGNMPRAVGTGLDDMHHAAPCLRIAADIERICSHQYPAYRLYARVKFHFSHRAYNL